MKNVRRTYYHITYTDVIVASSLEEAEHKLLADLGRDVHEGDVEAFEITPHDTLDEAMNH